MDRITFEELYLSFAKMVSFRSTCGRVGNGAVITSEDMYHVHSIGYNGSPRKNPHNCQGAEAVGTCGCIHAEINAILKVPVRDDSKVMFCTSSPCSECAKFIVQSGFSKIIYNHEYRIKEPIRFLADNNIIMVHMPVIMNFPIIKFSDFLKGISKCHMK